MKRCLFFLLLALLSAVSCSTPRYVSSEPYLQDQWIGSSHAEIIREFGAPNREISDGADGQILVYENFPTTATVYGYSATIEKNRSFKEFYLDAEGNCYDVRSNESRRDGRKEHVFGTFMCAASAAALLYYCLYAVPYGS